MASIASTLSGSTVTYTITDVAGNTGTVTAPPPGQPVSFSSTSGLLNDGLAMLSNLVLMLQANGTSPRPQVQSNSTGSFFS